MIKHQEASEHIPLCVDMDGTLLATDSLHELVCVAFKRRPFQLLGILTKIFSGKAAFKRELAEEFHLEPESLPYNEDVLSYLRQEKARGRKIILVTACDERTARPIADHAGLFDEVMSSDGKVNLSGENKLKALVARFGEKRFDYIGNSHVDIPVWRGSRTALVCNSSSSLQDKVRSLGNLGLTFKGGNPDLKVALRAIRLHQWVKNFLIFVPIVMAHQAHRLELLSQACLGFLAFCLCASSVYLLNDLFDLESDRAHAQKRFRPLASGEMPLLWGLALVPILLSASFLLSLLLPVNFMLILGVYFACTLAYSSYFKQIVIIDIILLALLYAVRVLAGGYAAEVEVSHWLLAFSLFFFLSLACAKRVAEIFRLRKAEQSSVKGRGYRAGDLEQIAQFGSSAGYISCLVLALYISSKEVVTLYPRPQFLWLICPLLLYWISRVWLLAHRGELQEDPILFAIRDRASYLVGLLSALLMLLAAF